VGQDAGYIVKTLVRYCVQSKPRHNPQNSKALDLRSSGISHRIYW